MCVPLLACKLMRAEKLSGMAYWRQYLLNEWIKYVNIYLYILCIIHYIYNIQYYIYILNLTKFISVRMHFAMSSMIVPQYHVYTWIYIDGWLSRCEMRTFFQVSYPFFFIMATAPLYALYSSARKSERINSANYWLLYCANKHSLAILDSHLYFMMK